MEAKIAQLATAGEGHGLTGTHRVRVFRPAFGDAHRWFPKASDRAELRSHSLKLRYWPEKNKLSDDGQLCDLDWCWVQACKGLDIGELRIDDTIGGHDNIRILFYRGDPGIKKPLPIIWILYVLQKKNNAFTKQQIEVMKSRRILVIERFYKRHEFE